MASPDLIAAVSAAVKGEEIPQTAATDVEGGNPPAVEAAEAQEAAEDLIGTPPEGEDKGEAAAAAPQAGDEKAPLVDSAGRIKDPITGKFLPKGTAEAKVAAPKEEAPKAEAPPQVAKGPVDPVNDPIPPNLKQETRERMTTLVETVKTKDQELGAVREDLQLLLAPIQEAGATVEQFREAMRLVKLVNSPHHHEQQQALQYLQGAGAQLAERLGVVPPGVDPLAGHMDLMEQAQANPALRPTLEETAKLRRAHAAMQQSQQQQVQRTEQQSRQQQALQAGQDAVRAVEQSLEAADPNYKAKVAVMRADAVFIAKLQSMPPGMWAQTFAEKYRSVSVAAPTPPAPVAPSAPAPLRSKQPAGGTARPPANTLEVVRGALSELRAH